MTWKLGVLNASTGFRPLERLWVRSRAQRFGQHHPQALGPFQRAWCIHMAVQWGVQSLDYIPCKEPHTSSTEPRIPMSPIFLLLLTRIWQVNHVAEGRTPGWQSLREELGSLHATMKQNPTFLPLDCIQDKLGSSLLRQLIWLFGGPNPNPRGFTLCLQENSGQQVWRRE